MNLFNIFLGIMLKIMNFEFYGISIFNYLIFMTIFSIIFLVVKKMSKD